MHGRGTAVMTWQEEEIAKYGSDMHRTFQNTLYDNRRKRGLRKMLLSELEQLLTQRTVGKSESPDPAT